MKNTMTAVVPSIIKTCALGVALSLSALSAYAAPAPYGDTGNENLVEYSFTAAASGDIVAYFVSKGGADFTNTLRVYINGVDTGISGLVNQTSSYGESVNFGSANAGDSVVFAIDVENTGKTWFSDKSQNIDNVNRIFAAAYEGDDVIPVGTYIAFEDLTDFNYLDEQFVVTNLSRDRSTPEVPVPAAAWLFGSSLIGLAGVARRRTK